MRPLRISRAQQAAYLDSVEQQILQGVMQADPTKIELAQAMVGAIRVCLESQLAAGKSLSQAAEFCGDIVQQAGDQPRRWRSGDLSGGPSVAGPG